MKELTNKLVDKKLKLFKKLVEFAEKRLVNGTVHFFQPDQKCLHKFFLTAQNLKLLDKNPNIFQTARFNHTMIFFKLTD